VEKDLWKAAKLKREEVFILFGQQFEIFLPQTRDNFHVSLTVYCFVLLFDFLSLNTDKNVPLKIKKQNNSFKIIFYLPPN
jgi:hypothetical protein